MLTIFITVSCFNYFIVNFYCSIYKLNIHVIYIYKMLAYTHPCWSFPNVCKWLFWPQCWSWLLTRIHKKNQEKETALRVSFSFLQCWTHNERISTGVPVTSIEGAPLIFISIISIMERGSYCSAGIFVLKLLWRNHWKAREGGTSNLKKPAEAEEDKQGSESPGQPGHHTEFSVPQEDLDMGMVLLLNSFLSAKELYPFSTPCPMLLFSSVSPVPSLLSQKQ